MPDGVSVVPASIRIRPDQDPERIHQSIKDVLTLIDPDLLDWLKDIDTIARRIANAKKI